MKQDRQRVNCEPAPIWPDLPRLCADVSLPPYRYVPGLNAHPVVDPQGHSYGQTEDPLDYLPPESWQQNSAYLYGIDLYHQGFFWEAHEAWESLWVLTGRDEPEGRFLQALIQNTAAQLKVHMLTVGGVRSLSRHAWEKLCFVRDSDECAESGHFMGIHVGELIEQIERYYGRLWDAPDSKELLIVGLPPKLWPTLGEDDDTT